MISRWYGLSRVQPVVVRFRTRDGDYGLRVTCWHGRTGELAYPHRATIESWEQSASLVPCRWVEACPHFADSQDPERYRQSRDQGFVNFLRADFRTVRAERKRRKEEQ